MRCFVREIFAPKSWLREHTLGCFSKSISRARNTRARSSPLSLVARTHPNNCGARAERSIFFMQNCRSESCRSWEPLARERLGVGRTEKKSTRRRHRRFLALDKSLSSSPCKSYFAVQNFLRSVIIQLRSKFIRSPKTCFKCCLLSKFKFEAVSSLKFAN